MNTDVDKFEAMGRTAASLLLPEPPNWIHRRVQSLRYLDSSWTEIRLSVDFDAPDSDLAWVPVTVLPKWPPLFRVDFRDSNNRPVPLLTSDENGAADYGLMAGLADAIDESWLRDTTFERSLSTLTRGPETELDGPFIQLLDVISAHGDLTSPSVSRFVDLAANLITSTLLWYPIDKGARGQRTIAKVAYHWPDRNTDNLVVRALRSMSWAHPTEWMPLPHIGGEANFHLEIEAPAPLIVRSIEEPLFWRIRPERASRVPESDKPELGSLPPGEGAPIATGAHADALEPEQYVDKHANLAHAYVSGPRPGTSDIEFRLAPPRAGFVGAAFVASVLIAAFETVMNKYRLQAVSADNRDAAVALLAIVPAVIGYLVVRPTDPAIVRRHLLGVQITIGAAAAVPVMMGVLVIHYANAPHCLRSSWRGAVLVSWGLATVLLISVVRSGSRRTPEHEH